ncbi:MAG: methanogenesis marker protein Mmp4/MtxX [Candidatus Methanomethyliaceae archaeon]|nr:methanogenesis marker protein Mmp4/MtxX [Candidatus Methanomethyliaceae archaeon]MCX8169887.1 methanogenesis marker protein Mmp4/MtxX [Candidatus Methanomethyliaceae archaeon]MDW7970279.1 methanogenesis marker protein Mmp4/MtxX [Nitrososphaerota archaeon]
MIYSLAKANKAIVAIGVDSEKPSADNIINSAIFAKKHGYANPIIVCNKKITTEVPCIVSNNIEERLIHLLASGEVEAAIRGNLSARSLLHIMKSIFGCKNLYRITMMEITNRPIMLAPVGIDEGDTLEDLIEFALRGKKIAEKFGLDYKVGVISGGRHEDKGRSKKVDEMLEQSEILTKKIEEIGLEVENFGIEIERAIESSNIIIAPDGIIGNLIFRSLVLIANIDSFGAYASALPKVYIDTSRARTGFLLPIIFASALAK